MSSRTETARGLAPRSWLGVFTWGVIITIFISNPAALTGFVISSITNTGAWINYQAFADCGTKPPMDWMTTKPCNHQTTDTTTIQTTNSDIDGEGEGYVVSVDSETITSGLDAGVDAFRAVHNEISEIQQSGGVTVHVGETGTDQ